VQRPLPLLFHSESCLSLLTPAMSMARLSTLLPDKKTVIIHGVDPPVCYTAYSEGFPLTKTFKEKNGTE